MRGIVEYWLRDNIDAHADIDETKLEDDGNILCSDWGHVLYLVVEKNAEGESDDQLRGPTCVFLNE